MIRPRIRLGPPPKPLTAVELARVHAWQRNMLRFYGIAIAMIALGWVIMLHYSEAIWVPPALFVMVVALMVGGAIVQFHERCPRCGAQLGKQSRIVLPSHCKGCGVDFPKAGDGSQTPRA